MALNFTGKKKFNLARWGLVVIIDTGTAIASEKEALSVCSLLYGGHKLLGVCFRIRRIGCGSSVDMCTQRRVGACGLTLLTWRK